MVKNKRAIIVLFLIFVGLVSTDIASTYGKRVRAKARATVIAKSGAWSWFADPRAVYYKKRHSQTYVGWVDLAGNINLASYNHRSGNKRTVQLMSRLQIDDHANPALMITPSGRIAVFWSAHTGRKMFYRVSKYPEDISRWGRIQAVPVNTMKKSKLGYTYPNPLYLRSEKKTYLFWRGGNAQPTFSTSANLKKWTAAKTLIRLPGRPYLKVESNGKDKIHFAFTNGHPRESTTNIYYFYYKRGSFYKADGTFIGKMNDLPLDVAKADMIHNANQSKVKAWIHDIAVEKGGNPVLVYATFRSRKDHRYHYARWTGSTWFSTEMTKAGGTFNPQISESQYSGGISLDHENPSTVYLSRKIGRYYQVEKWWTKDQGLKWRLKRISKSRNKNLRPFSPRGLKSDNLSVIWMRGAYSHFKNFHTSLVAYQRVTDNNQAPNAAFKTSSRKGRAPLTIVFNASRSSDSDGRIVKYRWFFRDGTPVQTGVRIEHTFTKKGNYFVILDVIDNRGKRDQLITEISAK